MNQLLSLLVVVILFVACQKEDLRAPDFVVVYRADQNEQNINRMTGTITNISSTPANTVSIRIDRFTDFNLVQDPIYIVVDKTMYQNDTAQFTFESSPKIKRVEINVVNVK